MIIMIIKILNVSFTSKNSDNKIEVTIIEDVWAVGTMKICRLV